MFEDLAKTTIDETILHLGSSVTFKDKTTNIEYDTLAIINKETIEIDPTSGEAVLTNNITLDVSASDISPEEGDQFIVESKNYTVREVREGNFGAIKVLIGLTEYVE